MCGLLHVWSATCVVGYMCGWLHVWLATCVVGYMCGWLHVWLVTCVVGYMCGWLHVCLLHVFMVTSLDDSMYMRLQMCYVSTVRDTDNLNFRADIPRRYSEDICAAVRNVRVGICGQSARQSADSRIDRKTEKRIDQIYVRT